MPAPPPNPLSVSDDARISPAGRPPESAHYLRQATITLRRRSSRLNRMLCKNRLPITSATTWKP